MPIYSGLDEHLEDWGELRNQVQFTGILVGNGASLAVWEQFNYASLYEVARVYNQTHRLTEKDLTLFRLLDTCNFENVLAGLATAGRVTKALSIDVPEIEERYISIQQALIEAVKGTHVPWDRIPPKTFETIRAELNKYYFVYSTNSLCLHFRPLPQGAGHFRKCLAPLVSQEICKGSATTTF